MKERPILFSAPMVRAILEGRKTQTRRICKAQPPEGALWGSNGVEWMWLEDRDDTADRITLCPYGVVGDRLWVRESATVLDVYDSPHGRRVGIRYGADDERAVVAFPERLKAVKVGQKMPNGVHREGARITLEVTGVRVERLNAISEDDARAEGVHVPLSPAGFSVMVEDGGCFWQHVDHSRGVPVVGDEAMGQRVVHVQPTPAKALTTAEEQFANLWRSINGADSWDANPWVWVVEFKAVQP